MTHPQVLSDERMAEVLTTVFGWSEWTMDDVRSARAIESAILEALSGQAVAWGLFVRVEDGGWHGGWQLQHPVRFTQEDAQADIAMYVPTHQFKVEPLIVATTNPPAKQEPFGYFKATPFGWTDCASTDEGAVALYERPQKSA